MKMPRRALTVRSIIAICLAVVVIAMVIVGVSLLDSPAQERLRRLDERRVDDLRELSNELDFYWTREGTLPGSLEELANEPGVFVELFDPETGQPYEYRIVGYNTYELCAVFALDTAEEQDRFYKDVWSHGPGRQCFQLEAQDVHRGPEMR